VEAAKRKVKAALEDSYTATTTSCFELLGRRVQDLCQQWAIHVSDNRLCNVILRRNTLQQILVHEAKAVLVLTGVHQREHGVAGGGPRHPAAVVAAAQLQARDAGGGAAMAAQLPGTWKCVGCASQDCCSFCVSCLLHGRCSFCHVGGSLPR
jgi:hypothetical protein